jgi:epsilon-lactone hydrolase
MTSIQGKIVNKLSRFLFNNWSEGSISEQRARQEKSTRFARLPKNVCFQPIIINGIPSEWIEANNSKAGVILYLHGGAYALGSINSHREFLSRLALFTQIKILAINYRLAPEHPFPAALEDALTAYHYLLTQGFDPSQVIIAGDSAGGGLTLAALISLRDAGEKLPAGAFCISPWVDLSFPDPFSKKTAKPDPILSSKILEGYAKYYAGNTEPTNPLISPIYADLRGLPPLLIHVGENEILLDESIRFSEKARQAGVIITLVTWEGMFHVFQLFSFLPETQKSMEQINSFVSIEIAQP